MAGSKNRRFSKLATDVDANGDLQASGIRSEALNGGVTVYASRASLPTSGNTSGDQAYVTENNRLYIWNESGWYNVALINRAPTITSVLDSDGEVTPFSLATDGTATTITIIANDSDGDPVTYTASADSDFSGLATLSQADNVFTITPLSEDSATTESGTITFTATDGINIASSGIQTFTLSFVAFEQAQKITSSSVSTYSYFGYDIEVDGSTMVVGAYGDNTTASSHGSAWIYTKSGSTWTLQDELDAPALANYSVRRFGWCVAISGDTAIIGAPHESTGYQAYQKFFGAAHIYTRSGSTWSLQQTIQPAGLTANTYFGWDVAIDGDTAVMTTYPQGSNTDDSRAYIYTRSGSTWSLQQTIDPIPSDGGSVSLSGDTLVLGSLSSTGAGGPVSVYTRSGSTWSLQQTLTPSVSAQYHGGGGLVLDGDTLAVSASGYSSSTGAVFVYTRSGSTWTEQQIVTADSIVANSSFGGGFGHFNGIGLKGDVMVVGAPFEAGDVGYQAGFTYVFERSGSTWSQTARLSPEDVVGHSTSDNFGRACAVDTDTVLIGSPGEDEDGADTGAVYIFVRPV